MNNSISKIKHLYAYEDGDTITPRMGVQIEAGYALQQFYDANTGNVTQTNFKEHPATLFPQAWSSKKAKTIVPSTTGQQWYYNNISDNAGILDASGAVKAAYKDLFETTTVTVNGITFPALKIKGNLVDASSKDFTDKYIYYVGTSDGKQFTCQQLIPVRAAAKDALYLLIQAKGADGIMGDDVLSDANDYVEYSAYLQQAGSNVTGATFEFQHMEDGAWKTVTHNAGICEVGTNTLKLFDAAVEGTDLYRCVATFNGEKYYATMEPSDEHDPYYIVDGCNISGDTVEPGQTVTFNPKVYERHYDTEDEDVTAKDGWTFAYTLIRRQDGTVITDLTVTGLTYDNISAKGGLSVRIQATKA